MSTRARRLETRTLVGFPLETLGIEVPAYSQAITLV